MPACVAPILTFRCGYATEFLTCSKALPAANIANELAKTVLPQAAIPAAVEIIFASAIPIFINLSGNFFLNTSVFVDFERSASSTKKSYFSPNSASASP